MITRFILFSFFCSMVTASQSLLPADVSQHMWFLKNLGSSYRLFGYDLRWQDLNGKPGADIGLLEKPLKLRKKVRIAVVDSGVLPQHPYLNGFVHWENLEKYKATIAVQAPGRPFQMTDETGHGTHISGILASVFRELKLEGQNPEDFIEIIPLKVFAFSEDPDFLQNRIFENFKAAILQALELKVDVILTSTSWPRLKGFEALDEILEKVAKSGAIFVTASGNKLSRNIMLPCDSRYVFCVGASNQQGQFATQFSEVRFGGSNYSLAVDALAPGVSILSSYIADSEMAPAYTINGAFPMVHLDGTSQAAPIVAAVATVLKSAFPVESRESILSRLYLGADAEYANSNFEGLSTSLFGPISLKKSVEIQPQALVLPQFKNRQEFTFLGSNTMVPLELICVNGPCESTDYQVYLRQKGHEKRTSYSGKILFKEGASLLLNFPFDLKLDSSSEVELELHLQTKNFSRSFRTILMAQRDPRTLSHIKILDYVHLEQMETPLQVLGSSTSKSVVAEVAGDMPKVSLIDYENSTQKTISIRDLQRLRFAFQRDVNHDGVEDLVLVYTIKDSQEKAEDKKIQEYIAYYDLNLQPLVDYPKAFKVEMPGSLWPFEPTLIKWRTLKRADRILDVPVLFGILPQTSRATAWTLHPRSFLDSMSFSLPKKQVMSFDFQDDSSFQMKTLSDYDFYTAAYKHLDLDPNDEINFIEVMTAIDKDHRFLLVARKQDEVKNFIVEADENFNKWTFQSAPFETNFSSRLRTQFWRPEVAESGRTFILQEYNKFQYAGLFQQDQNVFEFGISDSEPLKFFLDAVVVRDHLMIITANDFVFKSWIVSAGSKKAKLVSQLRYDYMNYHENSSQMLTHNFVRALPNGGREVIVQNAYWNGNRLLSLRVNQQGMLYYHASESYQIPNGCLASKDISQGIRPANVVALLLCLDSPKTQMFLERE